jgi:hypothetical protein
MILLTAARLAALTPHAHSRRHRALQLRDRDMTSFAAKVSIQRDSKRRAETNELPR